jgi:HK97 family phage portal protein
MAFVVTAGQITAIHSVDRASPWWGWNPSQTVALSPTMTMTYQQMWRAQPQLRTVVGFLARNVAQLGVDVYRRVSDTDRTKVRDHPVARLLEHPFPGSKLTKYRLLSGIMHDIGIYDNAFLLKVDVDGQPALLPISPRNIAPEGSEWTTAQRYVLRGDRGEQRVDADRVVHIFGYNPDDMRQGTSPIETLRQILAEEHAATMYREQLWRNGARVAGYLKRPKDAPRWSDPARERFSSSWQAQYTGEGPQAGGTPILEDGMEFENAGVSPKDAQYVESRRLTREEVAVAYHVSPAMVGMTEATNFSSMRELHTMLYQDTLAPYLQQIAQDLENQLLEDLDPDAADGSTYIEFNLAEKMRGSFEEQAGAFQSATGSPWMTRNEVRGMLNLSAVDGGDDLIVPLNVLAGGLASPNDTAPDNPSTDGNPKARELLRHTYRRQCKAVTSNIGAGHPDVFERGRWDAELAADLIKGGFADSRKAAGWAADINARTVAHLAPALVADDPQVAVQRVFDDLTRGMS